MKWPRGSAPRMSEYRKSEYTDEQMALMCRLNKEKIHYLSEQYFPRYGEYHTNGKIKTYRVDVLIDNIAIEIDGPQHKYQYDKERDALLFKQHEIKTVRFRNDQVRNEMDSVIGIIKMMIKRF